MRLTDSQLSLWNSFMDEFELCNTIIKFHIHIRSKISRVFLRLSHAWPYRKFAMTTKRLRSNRSVHCTHALSRLNNFMTLCGIFLWNCTRQWKLFKSIQTYNENIWCIFKCKNMLHTSDIIYNLRFFLFKQRQAFELIGQNIIRLD